MDSDQPLVSVVVRSMARPSLIRALTSIVNQTYRAVDIVVVAALGPEHPPLPDLGSARPRLVIPKDPLRRAAAANVGLAAARGTWITFLDDDDVFDSDHLGALMQAALDPSAHVVHCRTRSVFNDGSPERVIGQPHAAIELFERNYIHLSAAAFTRQVASACHFDESLEILEDWDFFLQLSKRTHFRFVPKSTFRWFADAGSSGAGGGTNYDFKLFSTFRARIRDKWQYDRKSMAEFVQDVLGRAQTAFDRRDLTNAASLCREALVASQNHPAALNMLATVQQAHGDLQSARATLELAHSARPMDVRLLYNLGLIYLAEGNRPSAHECMRRGLAIDASFAPLIRLKSHLDT